MDALRNKLILVLEDDPIVRELVADAVRGEGARTMTFCSLGELHQWLKLRDRTGIDAAILDLHLQHDSGLEAVQLLRQDRQASIVFAVFTALDFEEKRAAAAALGVSVFVSKVSGVLVLREHLCRELAHDVVRLSGSCDWRCEVMRAAAQMPAVQNRDLPVLSGLLEALTNDEISTRTRYSSSQVAHAIRRLGRVADSRCRSGIVGYFARVARAVSAR
jgi:CheY-like chemotaxis protein